MFKDDGVAIVLNYKIRIKHDRMWGKREGVSPPKINKGIMGQFAKTIIVFCEKITSER